MSPVACRHFAGFVRQILSPIFLIDLGRRSRETFVAEIDKDAEGLINLLLSRMLRRQSKFMEAMCV